MYRRTVRMVQYRTLEHVNVPVLYSTMGNSVTVDVSLYAHRTHI